MNADRYIEKYRITDPVNFNLNDMEPRPDIFERGKQARDASDENAKAISELSHKLYGEANRSMLIVLQGMDTSGKDGTTSAIFHRTPPLNVKVAAFKAPSKLELAHDYLWRIHNVCPAKGQITVFNRSHYEDVLVVKVKDYAPAEKVEQRYEQSDLDDRKLWPDFMLAYETMVRKTSTEYAPWHVIPSDSRSRRGAIISSIVRKTLEDMNPQYPDPGLKLADFDI